MRYYKPGDRIYIFGFSRGAFTARFLARMIAEVGLLSKGNEEMYVLPPRSRSTVGLSVVGLLARQLAKLRGVEQGASSRVPPCAFGAGPAIAGLPVLTLYIRTGALRLSDVPGLRAGPERQLQVAG